MSFLVAKKKNSIFAKKTIFLAVFLLLGFSFSNAAFADLYTPGATLNPDCLPTDTNCDVIPYTADNTDIGLNTASSTFFLILDGNTLSTSTAGLKISDAFANSLLSTTSASILYISSTTNSLLNYPTYGYASSTYYFASNPSGYITASALIPFLSTTSASQTYLPLSASTSLAYVVTETDPIFEAASTSLAYIPSASSSLYLLNSASTSLAYIPFASSSLYYLASNPSSYITASALSPYVSYTYASSTFPSFTYATNTFATILNYPSYTYASSTYISHAYASSTFPSFTYASSTYYLATNPSGYITASANNLTNYPSYTYASSTFPSFTYASSTYLFVSASTSLPYIPFASSTLYVTYPYASSTFPSFTYATNTFATYSYASNTFATSAALANYVTNTYATNTFPSFAYATNTYVNFTYATATFPSFAYASNTFATIAGSVTNAYASSTFPSFIYASSTYLPLASSTLYVPYTGATGGVNLNNHSLANVSTLSVGSATAPTGGVAYFNGNVGIGTTTPAVLLDVGNASPTIGAIATSSGVKDLVTLTGTYTGNTTQNLKIQITATSSTGDTFEWNVNGSTQNTGFIASTTAVALNYIGISVTFATTTGHTIGSYWTSILTPSNGNINASNAYYLNEGLFASAFGTGNTSVGLGSMSANTTGVYNTANGNYALYDNTTGYNNTANGYYALYSNTTGYQNTANGYYALYSNTTGSVNTANGYQALYSNTTGIQNTANGLNALLSNTSGGNNTANGFSALYNNTTGSNNTANGFKALYLNTTGGANTALGYQAGRYISGGSIANATSSNSLYLGYNTMALASGDTNEIVIGNGTVGLGSNTTVIGTTATTLTALYGNVGIGTTTALYPLTVSSSSIGQIQMIDTAATAGDYWYIGEAASNTFDVFDQAGVGMYMTNGGTSWTSASDERLKTNINTLGTTTLDEVLALNPVTYNWIATSSSQSEQVGFIAQQVAAAGLADVVVVPSNPNDCIAGSATATDCYGLDYDRFAPYLVKAIQVQQGFIATIETFINNLANGIAHLADIFVQQLTVGTPDAPTASGITMYDHTTGEAYCVFINNGAWTNSLGACGTQTQNTQTASVGSTDTSDNSSSDTSTSSDISASSTDATSTDSTDATSTDITDASSSDATVSTDATDTTDTTTVTPPNTTDTSSSPADTSTDISSSTDSGN